MKKISWCALIMDIVVFIIITAMSIFCLSIITGCNSMQHPDEKIKSSITEIMNSDLIKIKSTDSPEVVKEKIKVYDELKKVITISGKEEKKSFMDKIRIISLIVFIIVMFIVVLKILSLMNFKK